jgi:hypothetical protein
MNLFFVSIRVVSRSLFSGSFYFWVFLYLLLFVATIFLAPRGLDLWVSGSVADPHHFDADPDFHFDADPDSTFLFEAEADPTFHLDTDPDPAHHKSDSNLK